MFVKCLGSPRDITVILVMTQERERVWERAGGTEFLKSQTEASTSQHVMVVEAEAG